ncbi:MAG: PhnD/SsuA/transferrin family substrate-binding protein [Verrucomicrobia bacterium]|nr:PhnD/SsuA/transferrin family substrate-binding protein [Verrucomicrobiota bacterium]
MLPGQGGAAESTAVRVVISRSLFQDVSLNDAQAAIKVWGRTVAAARGVPVDPVTRVVEGVSALQEALQARQADLIGLLTDEYERLPDRSHLTHLFVSAASDHVEETYVVVTRLDGHRSRLADLAQGSLAIFGTPRMGLAEPWLDLELARQGSPAVRRHFGEVHSQAKLTKALLPVYFSQVDAALVTQRGFDTMAELNPQVGRQLRVIARSPAYIPMLFAIVKGMDPGLQDSIVTNMRDIHLLPTGRQLLNLFQGERLHEITAGELTSSLALLAEHRRMGPAPTGGQPH